MSRPIVILLRAVLIALFAGTVAAQVAMTWLIGVDLQEAGDLGRLRIPILGALIVGGLCVEAVLIAAWRLATLARRGRVFGAGSFRWVDLVIGAATLASALVLGVAVLLAPQPDAVAPPGAVLLVGLLGLAPLGVALVVLVMRALLGQSIAREDEARRLRAELEDVI